MLPCRSSTSKTSLPTPRSFRREIENDAGKGYVWHAARACPERFGGTNAVGCAGQWSGGKESQPRPLSPNVRGSVGGWPEQTEGFRLRRRRPSTAMTYSVRFCGQHNQPLAHGVHVHVFHSGLKNERVSTSRAYSAVFGAGATEARIILLQLNNGPSYKGIPPLGTDRSE